MFRKKNILVVGDIMLDKYSHGTVSRVSPEAPVPIVDIKKIIYKPGGASNVAQNLSALGSNVTLLGITGDDNELRELIKVLRHTDINFDPVKDLSIRTTLKSRIIGNDQQLMRLDHEDRNKSDMQGELLKRVIKYAKNSDLIILSDYDKGSVKPIAADISKGLKLNPELTKLKFLCFFFFVLQIHALKSATTFAPIHILHLFISITIYISFIHYNDHQLMNSIFVKSCYFPMNDRQVSISLP